ncbi:hypothetical protein OG455_11195 [Kitasatospora sp. NBC_01287]|uniref:hypothetical protein n=1 Tax=Kitasatospora sp. NBC_01287 TaxID=2903573 RepID=UPI002253BAFD|nr:hypothetical protein [Kitasatospora sp. NBC_01287]MCX4746079.1 hypothetical protein [Kitasatospora sp. NBC_01287]
MSIDFFGAAGDSPQGPAGPPKCSAKGCKAAAAWVLVWNNPKLHTPDRRKTWLACPEHRESLGQFLGVRGFLKETVALADWTQPPNAD